MIFLLDALIEIIDKNIYDACYEVVLDLSNPL